MLIFFEKKTVVL